MATEPFLYLRHRFPGEIISHTAWLYHLFSLSLRNIKRILAKRSVVVTHQSVRHWCRKFGGEFANRLRRNRLPHILCDGHHDLSRARRLKMRRPCGPCRPSHDEVLWPP